MLLHWSACKEKWANWRNEEIAVALSQVVPKKDPLGLPTGLNLLLQAFYLLAPCDPCPTLAYDTRPSKSPRADESLSSAVHGGQSVFNWTGSNSLHESKQSPSRFGRGSFCAKSGWEQCTIDAIRTFFPWNKWCIQLSLICRKINLKNESLS